MASSLFLSNITVQLSSQSFPNKINDELLSAGRAVAVCAILEIFVETDNCPFSVDDIVSASGSMTAGPVYGCISFKHARVSYIAR